VAVPPAASLASGSRPSAPTLRVSQALAYSPCGRGGRTLAVPPHGRLDNPGQPTEDGQTPASRSVSERDATLSRGARRSSAAGVSEEQVQTLAQPRERARCASPPLGDLRDSLGAGVRTCFQLPAILTTPANRASPSEVPAAPPAVTSTRSQSQGSSGQRPTARGCPSSNSAALGLTPTCSLAHKSECVDSHQCDSASSAGAGPCDLTDPVALERPPPSVCMVHDRLRIVGP